MKTFEQLGLDISISPRLHAANQILKFIKRKEIINVFNILDGEYELIEIAIQKERKAIGKSFEDLNMPYAARILLILKQNSTKVSVNDIIFEEGDRLIVCLSPKLKQNVEKIFKKRGILS